MVDSYFYLIRVNPSSGSLSRMNSVYFDVVIKVRFLCFSFGMCRR